MKTPMASFFAFALFFLAPFLLQLEAAPQPPPPPPSSSSSSFKGETSSNSNRPLVCKYCKEPVAVDADKTPKAAMFEHLEGCKNFDDGGKRKSEEDKDAGGKNEGEERKGLEKMMKEFEALTKRLDNEFRENVFEHFPRLANEMAGLCDQYCALEEQNKKDFDEKQKEVAAKAPADENAEKIIALEKQIAQMVEEMAKIAKDSGDKKEAENKKILKRKVITKPAVNLRKQPAKKLTIKEGEKKEEKSEQIGEKKDEAKKLPELDKRLAILHAETQPICRDALGRICSVEERIIKLNASVKDALVAEFLEKILPLAQDLRRQAEQLVDGVGNFKPSRRMENEDNIADFDDNCAYNAKHQLQKLSNRIVTVYELLNNNLELLTSAEEQSKKNGAARNSVYYL